MSTVCGCPELRSMCEKKEPFWVLWFLSILVRELIFLPKLVGTTNSAGQPQKSFFFRINDKVPFCQLSTQSRRQNSLGEHLNWMMIFELRFQTTHLFTSLLRDASHLLGTLNQQSRMNIIRNVNSFIALHSGMTTCPVADPGGSGGPGPPCPQDFFKIMQFSGNSKGKPLFWANFGLSPPLLGSKINWVPLTKILNPRLCSIYPLVK